MLSVLFKIIRAAILITKTDGWTYAPPSLYIQFPQTQESQVCFLSEQTCNLQFSNIALPLFYTDRHTLTLIVEMLVEGVQPVLQLIPGFCGEDNSLGSFWWRVDDEQTPGFLACWLLLHHTNPSVLQKLRITFKLNRSFRKKSIQEQFSKNTNRMFTVFWLFYSC